MSKTCFLNVGHVANAALTLRAELLRSGEALAANHGSVVLVAGVELVGTTMRATFRSVVVREANSRAVIFIASVEPVFLTLRCTTKRATFRSIIVGQANERAVVFIASVVAILIVLCHAKCGAVSSIIIILAADRDVHVDGDPVASVGGGSDSSID